MEQIINYIELNKIVDTLQENIRPKKIYLFGSYAYGQPDKESDIDLCIITDDNGKRKIEVLREARRALTSIVSQPIDLLVYRNEEFEERARLSTTLEYKIMNEGIMLYEQ
ncbi:DNA polymerase beta domain-containing protein region [Thermincola ferriacetica]|uniref:DNA polymerase beta domain-containing protein region n=1 Tax=Thermincola ferriacetica TaxID=281456 RepID=A0A0L6W4E7_9FIRM|nr:nucleotidyltransferase domain-containing protein [Thermincola ferriacetica]KNZ70432.1 DNA polymerase beta domain-containing protein region [Thermincola ferriacetica]